MSAGTIQFKVDTSALKAAIDQEIIRLDTLGEKAANQLMLEGINAAQGAVLKKTENLANSIPLSSSVNRISPCIFSITLGNGMDYGEAQEFGPKQSKKVWRFRPHIRPAIAIMGIKAQEVCERVFG